MKLGLYTTDFIFGSLEGIFITRKSPLILYPSDLQGNQLSQMLDYYLKFYHPSNGPLIKIVPHHGNSYSYKLSHLNPAIIYIPRCNSHVKEDWKKNYIFFSKLYNSEIIVESNHTVMLELSLFT